MAVSASNGGGWGESGAHLSHSITVLWGVGLVLVCKGPVNGVTVHEHSCREPCHQKTQYRDAQVEQ